MKTANKITALMFHAIDGLGPDERKRIQPLVAEIINKELEERNTLLGDFYQYIVDEDMETQESERLASRLRKIQRKEISAGGTAYG